jgi:hypothetical protein
VPLYVWIALLLVIAVSIVGIAIIVTRALTLWRTFKAFGRATDDTMARLAASLDRMDAKSATLGSGMPRLEAALARLQSDLARLAVLRQAVQDARESVGWILAIYPRK